MLPFLLVYFSQGLCNNISLLSCKYVIQFYSYFQFHSLSSLFLYLLIISSYSRDFFQVSPYQFLCYSKVIHLFFNYPYLFLCFIKDLHLSSITFSSSCVSTIILTSSSSTLIDYFVSKWVYNSSSTTPTSSYVSASVSTCSSIIPTSSPMIARTSLASSSTFPSTNLVGSCVSIRMCITSSYNFSSICVVLGWAKSSFFKYLISYIWIWPYVMDSQ